MRETVANQKRQKAARQASVNILEGSGRPPVAGDDGEGGFEMTVGPTMPYGDETERTNNIALTAYERKKFFCNIINTFLHSLLTLEYDLS